MVVGKLVTLSFNFPMSNIFSFFQDIFLKKALQTSNYLATLVDSRCGGVMI